MRGPVTPVCRVVVPCDAPFSAGFTVQHAGRLVAQFQSDSAGQFTVFLDPGGYTVVPNADAPLISPVAQAKSVTVGDTAQCPISEPSLRSASLRRATTIIEEPAETLTPANPADMVFRFGCTLDQLVAQALVVALAVIVRDELRDCPAEMTFAEWDHSVQALVLDRAHKAFRIRIRVGCLKRRLHDADPGLPQLRAHGRAPLRVPITDQHAIVPQDPFVRGCERAADLAHEYLVGMRR